MGNPQPTTPHGITGIKSYRFPPKYIASLSGLTEEEKATLPTTIIPHSFTYDDGTGPYDTQFFLRQTKTEREIIFFAPPNSRAVQAFQQYIKTVSDKSQFKNAQTRTEDAQQLDNPAFWSSLVQKPSRIKRVLCSDQIKTFAWGAGASLTATFLAASFIATAPIAAPTASASLIAVGSAAFIGAMGGAARHIYKAYSNKNLRTGKYWIINAGLTGGMWGGVAGICVGALGLGEMAAEMPFVQKIFSSQLKPA